MVTLLPSTATRTITITPADVTTVLTISAPSSAKKGASFNISGILVRADTGGPVPSASIPLSFNGNSLGVATTGVDGDYLKTVSIGVDGTFTLKAAFAGGGGYAASTAQTRLSVGEMAVPFPNLLVGVVAPILIGALLTYMRK